jgi:hypothetical protein
MILSQSANAVVMIRPHRFFPNPETAADNVFQRETIDFEVASMTSRAQEEFDEAVKTLRGAGVTVHVFDDTESPVKPDAVFPNNWFSTHHDGRIALYPMYSPTRRQERRSDIFDELRQFYRITKIVDYSLGEQQGVFLEGTGGLVLDHIARIAYASLSNRAHRELVERYCVDFDFEPVIFASSDEHGRPIYHTNVMMCIGTNFALLGADSIFDAKDRDKLRQRLTTSGKEVIELTHAQIANFCGNAIELRNENEKLLVLSKRAAATLSESQRATIERHAKLLPLSLPTIELAGGSARCMMATIHLPPL